MPVSSKTFSVRSDKLLRDEKLGSVILRLMMAVNDITITSSSLFEWQHTTDRKKKARWKGGVLYFGRVQSAHLFEALSIIKEIKDDKDLMTAIKRADSKTQESFASVAKFIGSKDYGMMAKLRNVVAFHYQSKKLAIRRLKELVDKSPSHSMIYSLGNATLDWYFELGDLIADAIVVRDVFQIPDSADLEKAATEVLDRLRIIALAFLDFAGYFIRASCAR
jgi:hypothetical protein